MKRWQKRKKLIKIKFIKMTPENEMALHMNILQRLHTLQGRWLRGLEECILSRKKKRNPRRKNPAQQKKGCGV